MAEHPLNKEIKTRAATNRLKGLEPTTALAKAIRDTYVPKTRPQKQELTIELKS